MSLHLLKINEVAHLVNANHKTVREWIKKGLLPCVRFGRSIRINEADLVMLVRTRTMTNAEVLR